MKRQIKIYFFMLVFLLAGLNNFAQSGTLQKDTLRLQINNSESAGNGEKQNIKDNNNNNQTGRVDNNTGTQAIKQVKTARPDMNKARGARPPDIVRPTGSRIPKGVGKPGGAIRPGRR